MDPLIFNYLLEHMTAIQAQEQGFMIQATSAPHLKKGKLKSLMRQLNKIATQVIRTVSPSYEIEVIEEDPKKAADWLAGQGVKIIDKKDG